MSSFSMGTHLKKGIKINIIIISFHAIAFEKTPFRSDIIYNGKSCRKPVSMFGNNGIGAAGYLTAGYGTRRT